MKTYLGVDVGKYELEIHYQKYCFTLKNTASGIRKLIQYMEKLYPHPVVAFEATGGYERPLKISLKKRGYSYVILHPNKVRALAKAESLLAKTDKIDAELIAHYAELMKVDEDNDSEENQLLKELLKRREELINEKNRESNRLDKEYLPVITRSIKKHIRWLDQEINAIEKQLKECSHEASQRSDLDLLTSIPGVGELTACYLLAYLPEIKSASPGELAALVGIAPGNRDSGSYSGKRYIQGGFPFT
jgi:transposase